MEARAPTSFSDRIFSKPSPACWGLWPAALCGGPFLRTPQLDRTYNARDALASRLPHLGAAWA